MKNILIVCLAAFFLVGCQREVTVLPPAQQQPSVIVNPSTRPNVIVVPGRSPHHHHHHHHHQPNGIHIRTPGAHIDIRK